MTTTTDVNLRRSQNMYEVFNLPLVDLDRSRQNITRRQQRRIRRTFPFLQLPGELRNMIYFHYFDFSGTNDFFERRYKELLAAKKPSKASLSAVARRTPTVFLINRQVFREALVYLRRSGAVHFQHGLLKYDCITQVFSANLLQNIASIEVTDIGHLLLNPHTLWTSWGGHMRLIETLVRVIRQGHHLQSFRLAYTDQRFETHINHCFHQKTDCDFRDGLIAAVKPLFEVRGIKRVEFGGIPRALAEQLEKHMTRPRVSFTSIPIEIRCEIYKLVFASSDMAKVPSEGVKATKRRKICVEPCSKGRMGQPGRKTPAILLVNKQISKEARGFYNERAVASSTLNK